MAPHPIHSSPKKKSDPHAPAEEAMRAFGNPDRLAASPLYSQQPDNTEEYIYIAQHGILLFFFFDFFYRCAKLRQNFPFRRQLC